MVAVSEKQLLFDAEGNHREQVVQQLRRAAQGGTCGAPGGGGRNVPVPPLGNDHALEGRGRRRGRQ
jgi:hypothetical protein